MGVHVLINGYDVPHVELLRELIHGRPLLDRIVRELDLHVVAQTGHLFEPCGYSYAYVLSESHFTIHTYPEHRSFYMDIFCCSSSFVPSDAVAAVQRAFGGRICHQVVAR